MVVERGATCGPWRRVGREGRACARGSFSRSQKSAPAAILPWSRHHPKHGRWAFPPCLEVLISGSNCIRDAQEAEVCCQLQQHALSGVRTAVPLPSLVSGMRAGQQCWSVEYQDEHPKLQHTHSTLDGEGLGKEKTPAITLGCEIYGEGIFREVPMSQGTDASNALTQPRTGKALCVSLCRSE